MKTPEQSEIDAANNATLFNIPPNTWRDNWIGALKGEPYSIGFWIGVFCSTSFDDPDYDNKQLLASIVPILRHIK